MNFLAIALLPVGLYLAWRLKARLLLSRAKHPNLAGHPRMALRLARMVPRYTYSENEFFGSDEAATDVVERRRGAFSRLAHVLRERAPKTMAASAALETGISDVAFVNRYRVPYQFEPLVRERLPVMSVAAASDGAKISDLDGNWSYDLGGAYGVNLFGVDFYKRTIARGVALASELGLVLGPYHPLIADNVDRLKRISGLDEVSFHMSGTEAVMQAIRLARYHTRRTHVVRFTGAYHGWGDVIQVGVGNPVPARGVYTLREMHALTLEVLRTRNDIACVLVNPIQAMHPNRSPASDSTLIASDRVASYDKAAYAAWLRELRAICTERGIALIFDEVFLGFRLAYGGAQEYFGVRADIVTYGKTLGGGLPVGVVCGRHEWMTRFSEDRPVDICFARGTFNSHPYVMATMNEFLRHLDTPSVVAHYEGIEALWIERTARANRALAQSECPIRIVNMVSIWTTLFTAPGRYNWLFQFYLRAEGLSPSWIGSGRFIFSHDLTEQDFATILERFVAAGVAMKRDGWWEGRLSDQQIKRKVTREMLSALFGGRSYSPEIVVAANAAALPSSSMWSSAPSVEGRLPRA